MSYFLGIDTGGTYTDSVIFCEKNGVIASNKSLTTKENLFFGIEDSCKKTFDNIDVSNIKMVSLSTTLATNAVVEKQGSKIGLIMIGGDESIAKSSDIQEALGGDPMFFVDGGHDHVGFEKTKLDEEEIINICKEYGDKVEAFAICSIFSTRNNEHEKKAASIIQEHSSLPTTCSSDLASSLDAKKRGVTALLNAKLIGQIANLMNSVKKFMEQYKINCPLMIVRGDGSLISSEFAVSKPIETIMSGPAASVVGASYLTGSKNILVSDVGGTTTDVAKLIDGEVKIDEDGASVNGWKTMVRAVKINTYGLGGDSRVNLHKDGIALGPRRVIPVSLLVHKYPSMLDELKRQRANPFRKTYDGMFALRNRNFDEGKFTLTPSEQRFWDKLENGPMTLEILFGRGGHSQVLDRLVDKGLIIYSMFTPSDACHVLGMFNHWNTEAAIIAAQINALRERVPGTDWANDEFEFSQMVYDEMILASSMYIVNTIYEDSFGISLVDDKGEINKVLRSTFADKEIINSKSGISLDFKYNDDIVGIGASAFAFYPKIAETLQCDNVVSDNMDVANAVGAVVAKIVSIHQINILSPQEGEYKITGDENIYRDLDEAIKIATDMGTKFVSHDVEANLGKNIEVKVTRQDRAVDMGNGKKLFLETILNFKAKGDVNL